MNTKEINRLCGYKGPTGPVENPLYVCQGCGTEIEKGKKVWELRLEVKEKDVKVCGKCWLRFTNLRFNLLKALEGEFFGF
jgi:DNA-directed RNA polymerase subunit RPC12/RpoP